MPAEEQSMMALDSTSGFGRTTSFSEKYLSRHIVQGTCQIYQCHEIISPSMKIADFIALMKFFSMSRSSRLRFGPAPLAGFSPQPGGASPHPGAPKNQGRLGSRPWSTLSDR